MHSKGNRHHTRSQRNQPDAQFNHSASRYSQAGPSRPSIPPSAYVQAYEAQLVFGALDRAAAIERKSTGALIRYAGDVDEEREIWADRHDIIHLLPSLPTAQSRAASPTPSSSSSGDSLPSDIEETFNLSDEEELRIYQTEKKRKWLDRLREERIRERELQEQEEQSKRQISSAWVADEVPSAAVLTLMTHTATSIIASPSPALLEIRILTNHAADERFSFLKGRWKDAWERAKLAAKRKKDGKRAEEERKKGLGGLGDYASDDESEQESEREDGAVPPPPQSPPPPPPDDEDPPPPSTDNTSPLEGALPAVTDGLDANDEEEKRRIRRQRAEEWKRKRAAGQS